jgi:S-adenosylmethionine synthetase
MLTSESVTEGHPDKICDQISDAVLDVILGKDPYGRVACETGITNGLIIVMGEITTDCYVEVPQVVRKVVHDIGYTRPEYGFDFPFKSNPRILLWGWTNRRRLRQAQRLMTWIRLVPVTRG